ncbi:cell division control protein 45 homolog isoform X2 [Corticium candelabrum]|uniref:cell division control protein 45 homolog isoform X2 n=1 Tax=Corticium candelabrum TaxID=121492 RepID=UPI002E26F276|nr:cell division control protein 45 homolog isoform X2 [Corticium candelabrum]
MFVENFKDDFYTKIINQRLLILVALEADALCACKILQSLLHGDNIQYTLVPVDGVTSLQGVFEEHGDQIKHVVMINCGGSVDILEILQPQEDVSFYIIDSHRPLFLDNIFNQQQVKLLVDSETEAFELPEFDDIYRSDSEDDEGRSDLEEEEEEEEEEKEHESETEPAAKRPHRKETRYQRQRRRRLWLRRRDEIKHKYYYYAHKGTASALLMFDLGWKLSKDNVDLLWYGIVGLADQYVNCLIDREKYVTDLGNAHNHVLRLCRNDTEGAAASVNSRKIVFDNELCLTLYRHWTLYDSLYHSEYTSCRFRVWTVRGQKRLQEFLADIGVPLSQCKQKFSCMDVEMKTNVKEWITKLAEKYGLDKIMVGTFYTQFGYCNKVCAEDMAHCLSALLHSPDRGQSVTDNFHGALDALTRTNTDLLQKGLRLAQDQQVAVSRQVKSFIDMRQPINAGQFIYAHVDMSMPYVKYFMTSSSLFQLARFLMNAWNLTTKKAKELSFVLSVPLDSDQGTCLIVGIPSVMEEQHRSFLGRAFEHAAARSHVRAKKDSFDAAVIELKMDDRMEFCDALSHVLST